MIRLFTVNETLREFVLGILFFGIAVCGIGIWIVEEPIWFAVGLFLGIGISCGAVWHMYKGLDIGLELGEAAAKYVTRQNLIRYGLIILSYGIICLWKLGDPVAAFIGIMGIKAGAYLQPLTHKIITFRKRR